MNRLELKMVDSLKELMGVYGAIGIKAEFEAEGTRVEELLRLKEICMKAKAKLILKIGGCESVRDMLEAKVVGVDVLVAPMVETPYALRKYLQAVNKVFTSEDLSDIEVLTNVETGYAVNNLSGMLNIPEIKTLKGIVVERYDLMSSMGITDEEELNGKKITSILEQVCAKAVAGGLTVTVGGGVSDSSVPVFRGLSGLTRHETRKVCFDTKKALSDEPERGILKALSFELLWLKNKLDFNKNINDSDLARIRVIEARHEAMSGTIK